MWVGRRGLNSRRRAMHASTPAVLRENTDGFEYQPFYQQSLKGRSPAQEGAAKYSTICLARSRRRGAVVLAQLDEAPPLCTAKSGWLGAEPGCRGLRHRAPAGTGLGRAAQVNRRGKIRGAIDRHRLTTLTVFELGFG